MRRSASLGSASSQVSVTSTGDGTTLVGGNGGFATHLSNLSRRRHGRDDHPLRAEGVRSRALDDERVVTPPGIIGWFAIAARGVLQTGGGGAAGGRLVG